MLTYHTKQDLESIKAAINSYELRNLIKHTEEIKDDSVVNLASGIISEQGFVKSISINLKLYDLTLVKEIVCKQYRKSEIVIFENVKELVMFINQACKEQLLSNIDLGAVRYA
ncbi:hypothetical protein QI339_12350 [Staphylococcus saprophyticus]|nr:hypothetical protein [Staphylococcus saprophyticus]